MYKQKYTTKAKNLPMILGTVVLGLLLLCIPSIFKITQFVWIYELAVIVFTSYAVYQIIKKSSYVYTYHIIDDEIAVQLSVGHKENVLCTFEIRDIISVNNGKIKELKEANGCQLVYKCIGSGDSARSTQIIFREEADRNKISMLIFMPDTEFLKILNQKRLDIQTKV
ncbi:MAG: hypothetical protein IJN12_00235 [Clostridia bacterium]|nr:hypothetical protein [Clostridia bacterium]